MLSSSRSCYCQLCVQIQVDTSRTKEAYTAPAIRTQDYQAISPTEPGPSPPQDLPTGNCSYRLEELAYARSGDKGNNCNIGRGGQGVSVTKCGYIGYGYHNTCMWKLKSINPYSPLASFETYHTTAVLELVGT